MPTDPNAWAQPLKVGPDGAKRRVDNNVQIVMGLNPDGSPSVGPIPVASSPLSGSLVDDSGAIASGGAAQQVAPANATRRYFFFQNNSDTVMWINFGVAAVANEPSIKIAPGATYENPAHFCQNDFVSVMCATTAKTYTCKEA